MLCPQNPQNPEMRRKLWVVLMVMGALVTMGLRGSDYSSPGATFEVYKQAIAKGDTETYLDCLTKVSQQMFSQRPAQASLMSREYQDIAGKEYKVTIKDETAILEFVPRSEIAPPYLFKKETGKWKIDLKRMSEEIVFDKNNHWHWR